MTEEKNMVLSKLTAVEANYPKRKAKPLLGREPLLSLFRKIPLMEFVTMQSSASGPRLARQKGETNGPCRSR